MCGCNQQASQTQAPEPEFEVRLPSGQTKRVRGEHNAKVETTMAGPGATYSRL